MKSCQTSTPDINQTTPKRPSAPHPQLSRSRGVVVVSNGDGDAHGLHASRFNNHISLGSNQEQALPSQISVRCRCIAGFKWRTDTVISDCVWGGLAAESRDYATSTPSVGCADRFPRTACTLWDCIARLAGRSDLQGESVDKKMGQGTCLPFNFLTFKK